MSTRCSVLFEEGYHLWEEAHEGPKYGLILSGDQAGDDHVDGMEINRVRLPPNVIKAVSEWYEKNKGKLP